MEFKVVRVLSDGQEFVVYDRLAEAEATRRAEACKLALGVRLEFVKASIGEYRVVGS